MTLILAFFVLFFILRIGTLVYSIRNERRLKLEGAEEFGKSNSIVLSLMHVLFYVSAVIESVVMGREFNTVSWIGVILFAGSYIILIMVIVQLREIWTVKLFIAKEHKVVKSFLFRTIRHPNYFLNILPELIGIGLLCNAFKTMLFVFPLYLVSLTVRIVQEERVMKKVFNHF